MAVGPSLTAAIFPRTVLPGSPPLVHLASCRSGKLSQRYACKHGPPPAPVLGDRSVRGPLMGTPLVNFSNPMIHFFPDKNALFPQNRFFTHFFSMRQKRFSKLHYRFQRYSTLPKTVLLESQYLQSYDDRFGLRKSVITLQILRFKHEAGLVVWAKLLGRPLLRGWVNNYANKPNLS